MDEAWLSNMETDQEEQDREDDEEDAEVTSKEQQEKQEYIEREERREHQRRVEEELMEMNLLPFPDQYEVQCGMTPDGMPQIPKDPLVQGYELLLHQLARSLQHEELRTTIILKERNENGHKATQAMTALLWLWDHYDLDELAQRVIGHVTGQEWRNDIDG